VGYVRSMSETQSKPQLTDEARLAVLNAEVAKYARQGWQVQSVVGNQAVLSKTKRIGWFWNLVLIGITFGIWLIVIIYRALNRKKNTLILTVDAYGKVKRS
jgi:hypothetical protein